jgi:hypothetical protein
MSCEEYKVDYRNERTARIGAYSMGRFRTRHFHQGQLNCCIFYETAR